MKKEWNRNFIITGMLFLMFLLFTLLVVSVDVQAIGPEDSEVGFASLNKLVHEGIGEHTFWYNVSKYAGLLPLLTVAGFAALGIYQLVRGKSLYKVDIAIVLMGVHYVLVGIVYVLFEKLVINYRPVIIDAKDGLEASYPSSHTILAISIMSAAIIYIQKRVKDNTVRIAGTVICAIVMAVVVVGRLLSGVHWFTDIIGGIILSASLVMLYYSMVQYALSLRTKKARRR